MDKQALFTPELLAAFQAAVATSDVFYTLGRTPAANIVSNISAAGFLVQTAAAERKGTPPQRVPAWMLQVAWDRLIQAGHLTNQQLLGELRVMRSSAVCAVLARLPGVEVEPGPGIVLVWRGAGTTRRKEDR